MNLATAFSRAKRGFRDDLRLHLVAVASLVVAFLCLGAALLSLTNLSRVADRWGQTQHLTIYLQDSARESDVAQLRMVLESLDEVSAVKHVSAAQAKKEFAEQAELGSDLATLPPDAFPASLEVSVKETASDARLAKIGARVKSFPAVEDVETYRDWFEQLGSLLNAGRSAAGALALLVIVCVLAVISNTIRLAIANRRREIEVLKLCGATNSFVRSPFLVEGMMQACTAALLALLLLTVTYFGVRGHIESALMPITGVRTVFLNPLTMAGILVGAAMVGALGSAMSLRRYLAV